MNVKNKIKRGFTVIELLVIIAILGILVLIAAPKFLGYSEEAQLARIKHDVKVMEVEIGTVMTMNEHEISDWDRNAKDLRELILKKNLFNTEGVVRKLEKSSSESYTYAKASNNSYDKNTLGMGGELYEVENTSTDEDYHYKIIPEEKKKKIRTKLKGTFYANSSGSVYYEPENPITLKTVEIASSCEAVEPTDYQFEKETGTIVKYLGNKQYLTIPAAFKVDGECWPVKIIGKGAFSGKIPPIKNVVIPPTVEKIEEDAFKENEIEKVIIPPNVKEVGDNAFSDNPIKDVVVQKPASDIEIGDNAFNGVEPQFVTPSDKDLGLDVKVNEDGEAVISGVEGGFMSFGSMLNKQDYSDKDYKQNAVVIPPVIKVDGKDVPVKEIEEGAFQGEGLIFVQLPNTLERIEDYAFAGNQLIGITIPENVKYVGYYAFAYNELTDDQGNYKATIGYIDFKGEEQIQRVEKETGDIVQDGSKINPLKGSEMMDGIWINSETGNEIISSNGGDSKPEPEPTPEPEITYPITLPNGDLQYEDGTITTPDGAIRQPDGSAIYPNGDIQHPDGTVSKMRPDGILVHPDGSVTLKDGTFVPIATDSDFTETSGLYKYIGTKTSLVLPNKINGKVVVSASKMFQGKSVERVVLLEHSITDMSYMFSNHQITTLDLTNFYTTGVTNMQGMFDLSKVLVYNLRSFDTSKVVNMDYMFKDARATTLDLSSFDVSKATVKQMFRYTSAKNGYARTQADADILSKSTTEKPTSLKFVVN